MLTAFEFTLLCYFAGGCLVVILLGLYEIIKLFAGRP